MAERAIASNKPKGVEPASLPCIPRGRAGQTECAPPPAIATTHARPAAHSDGPRRVLVRMHGRSRRGRAGCSRRRQTSRPSAGVAERQSSKWYMPAATVVKRTVEPPASERENAGGAGKRSVATRKRPAIAIAGRWDATSLDAFTRAIQSENPAAEKAPPPPLPPAITHQPSSLHHSVCEPTRPARQHVPCRA